MKFVLRADNVHTIIDEESNFKSLPVKFIMQSIFKKQHAQLFKNIEMKSLSKFNKTKLKFNGKLVNG